MLPAGTVEAGGTGCVCMSAVDQAVSSERDGVAGTGPSASGRVREPRETIDYRPTSEADET